MIVKWHINTNYTNCITNKRRNNWTFIFGYFYSILVMNISKLIIEDWGKNCNINSQKNM